MSIHSRSSWQRETSCWKSNRLTYAILHLSLPLKGHWSDVYKHVLPLSSLSLLPKISFTTFKTVWFSDLWTCCCLCLGCHFPFFLTQNSVSVFHSVWKLSGSPSLFYVPLLGTLNIFLP
jgi:hypothetical protein